MIHHGGNFQKNEDNRLVYSPDNRACLSDLDVDTLDVFYVRNYYKELGYGEIQKCWWLVPGRKLEVGLRNLDSDNELIDMCYHAQKNKGLVEVYYEHGVSLPEVLEGDTSVVYLDEEEDVGQRPSETPIPNFKPTLVDAPLPNSKPNEQYSNSNVGLSAAPTPTPTTANIVPIPKPQPSKPTNVSNKPNSTTKSSIPTKSSKPTNPKPSTKPKNPTKSTKPTNPKPSTKHTNPKKSTNPTSATNSSKPTQVRKHCTRSASKRGIAHVTQVSVHADDSSDSYESAEDEQYRPGLEGSSSSSDKGFVSVKGRRSSLKFKHASASAFAKLKEKIVIEDDGLVEDVSDGEVDIGFIGADFGLDPGIPCVHACAALSRVNKPPENFCHPLVTMESYKATYNHHINPIPGQPLWEVSEFNKPRAPKVKRPPGKLQMKRRMDSDEKHGGGKRLRVDTKNNDNTHLKRQLGKFTCSYCGDKGHTKRGYKKKRLADAAAAAAAAAAAVAEAEAATKNKEGEGGGDPTADQTCVATSDGTNQQGEGGNVQPIDLAPIVTAASDVQQVELDLSQPTCFEQEDSQQVAENIRPTKLPARRKSSPPPSSVTVNPLQGASSGTTSRMASLMKFVPTPGFKTPRKKT
ncbi:hypothetical protein Ahy_A05g022128 [Arachis hypogaea]|uniref:PB1-like domain-containing protein n=1 Tax=Arachis hypogaea TaxID=3818 RepID=A0A445CZT4_ARAHY|nr:hypothetical protein Ahy_A05g022128 [Arachis hypogaea]